MNNEIEVWKDLPEYEGLYQCSTFGRVLSYTRRKDAYKTNSRKYLPTGRKGGLIGTIQPSTQYIMCNLSKNGVVKPRAAHILVAITFLNYKIGSRKICINHIDGNRQNNHLNNLEIVSMSYNVKDGFNRGRIIYNKGKLGKDTLNYKMIYRYDKNMNYIDCFYGASEAGRILNICESSIKANAKGLTKTCNKQIFSRTPPNAVV